MILELKDICKNYIQGKEEVPVLKNIDLNVNEGDYLAIMGPSGSGKSTLMNIIGCLDRQSTGKFMFDGTDISTCKDKELSEIRNKKILIVDDVISTGESVAALEELVKKAKGNIAAKVCVLAEGNSSERKDIIYLEKLPVFPK